jgi:hypothetical protein
MNTILRARNNFGSLNTTLPPQAKEETNMKEDNNIIEETDEMNYDDSPKLNNWHNFRQHSRSKSPVDLTAPQYQLNDQYDIAKDEMDSAFPSDFAGTQQVDMQYHQAQNLLTNEADYNYDEMDTLIYDDVGTTDEGDSYKHNSQWQIDLQDTQTQRQVPMRPFTPVDQLGSFWTNENTYGQTEMQYSAPVNYDAYGEIEDEGMVHEFDNYGTVNTFAYERMEGGF